MRTRSWLPFLSARQVSMAGAASAVVLCMFLYLTVIPRTTVGLSDGATLPALSASELRTLSKRSEKRLDYTRRAIADVSWRPRDVILATHRGCPLRYPENSLGAIAACSEEGSHMTEIDLAMTKDGHVVLLHDDSLSRTTGTWWNLTIPVDKLTLHEVQTNYWLGHKDFTIALTSFRIPTFIEALQVARSCGIHFYIDAKGRGDLEAAMLRDIERENAYDYVLLQPLQTPLPKTHVAAGKARVRASIGNATAAMSMDHYPAAWNSKDPLRKTPRDMCQLRTSTQTPVILNALWENGEYFLRNPHGARHTLPWYYETSTATTHAPCPETHDAAQACLGAHLYQPLTQSTCARILVQDNPSTARAALAASRQLAPTRRFPVEPIRGWGPWTAPMIPACLQAWEQTRQSHSPL